MEVEEKRTGLPGHSHTISFGDGRHECLGEPFAYLQIKAIWSHLLRNFELKLISPFPEIDWNAMVVGVKGKVMVRYKRRQLTQSLLGFPNGKDVRPEKLPGPEILNATNMNGETALHVAVKNGSTEAVGVLLENGASVGEKANNGMTPLHLAVKHTFQGKDPLTVKSLLENKADWSLKDNMSQTTLHIAADINNVETIKYLLSFCGSGLSKLEAINKHGETPPHMATKNGFSGVAQVLLDHGASLEVRDEVVFLPF